MKNTDIRVILLLTAMTFVVAALFVTQSSSLPRFLWLFLTMRFATQFRPKETKRCCSLSFRRSSDCCHILRALIKPEPEIHTYTCETERRCVNSLCYMTGIFLFSYFDMYKLNRKLMEVDTSVTLQFPIYYIVRTLWFLRCKDAVLWINI